jgi:phosphoglycerate dehydrogenase-like enzyme
MTMKIAVLDDYQGYSRRFADWGALAGGVTVFQEKIPPGDLVERLAPFDVICVMRERTPIPATLIAALPRLKLIVTTGHRNAAIDVEAARARGIPVCGTDSRTPATAHLAMTLILAATRRLYPAVRAVAGGGWTAEAGRDLDGLTLGLVGLGRMGTAVAALARPFGVDLLGWSPNLTDARADAAGVRRAPSLGELLVQADIVSLHIVLSPRTRHLIGRDELALMKPDAVLVNTSRGGIVDGAALLSALRAGRPGAAAVDVYEEEPLDPAAPFRDVELIESGRLLPTPHIGYGALATYELMYRQSAENVRAWASGSPIRTL